MTKQIINFSNPFVIIDVKKHFEFNLLVYLKLLKYKKV